MGTLVMRINPMVRRLIVAGAVAAAIVVLPAAAAHAQGETPEPEGTETTVAGEGTEGVGAEHGGVVPGSDEAVCLELLEGGGSVTNKDCKPPNPVLPQLAEMAWAAGLFAVVAIFMMKFAVPRLRSTIEARASKQRDDLEGAERSKSEADTLLADYQRKVAEARAEASRSIDEARARADEYRKARVAEAEAEAATRRAAGLAEIQAATERVMAELNAQVAALSTDLASRVVERELDRSAQQTLIDSVIARAGNGRN
jgi:F-type H+-transporting ATPase subunit b